MEWEDADGHSKRYAGQDLNIQWAEEGEDIIVKSPPRAFDLWGAGS